MVVAGGIKYTSSWVTLSSTELLRPGASDWTYIEASIPYRLHSMASVSMAGNLFLSGGSDESGNYRRGGL